MNLTKLTPAEAKAKISQGAKLIDIRAADEHAVSVRASELGGDQSSLRGGRVRAAVPHDRPGRPSVAGL